MNKIITNLAQIADAAEYFDRKTGAAWKIRGILTNQLVWAANSVVYAQKADNAERTVSAFITLATLRVWARDSNSSAFVLDLTPDAVRRTLGLERVVDAHAEACRLARTKCLQTRSALRFKEYYDAALNGLEEQRRQREENVEAIAELLSDNQVFMTHEMADHCEYRCLGSYAPDAFVNDEALYDDSVVDRQADQLAETVGNALEAMYDVCEAELAAAITSDKINRLLGYHKAIQNMLVITGVDMKKLAERRAKLEALLDAQEHELSDKVADLDSQIAAQMAQVVEPVQAPPVSKKRVVKKANA